MRCIEIQKCLFKCTYKGYIINMILFHLCYHSSIERCSFQPQSTQFTTVCHTVLHACPFHLVCVFVKEKVIGNILLIFAYFSFFRRHIFVTLNFYNNVSNLVMCEKCDGSIDYVIESFWLDNLIYHRNINMIFSGKSQYTS